MKKFYAILCITIASLIQLQAQAPQGFNYQATVRNSSGDLVVNTNVYFKFNVMQGSQTSVPVYSETHYAPTDDLGQITLVIGQGSANTGAFSSIDWSLGSYYLGIELDTGNGYVAMGITQLLSVPYALYAENSGNAPSTTPNLQSVLAENNSANNQQIKDLQDPTEAQDAVTKAYADALSNTQGLMNFNGWDNYQITNDNTSFQLEPNSFLFLDANNTTLIFPSDSNFGDVIYIYVVQDNSVGLDIILQPNGFPIRIPNYDEASNNNYQGILASGLNTIINVGSYWIVGDFQGDFQGTQQIIPSNLVVTVTIQGQDDQNPNGDGSGQFSVTATATNAVKYGFKVGNNGSETQNTTGVFSYTLTEAGTNQFPLYVYAYSSTNDRISNISNLTVYVEGNGGSGNNDVLVWSDEFDGTGPINSSKWTTETGGGGWGNQEVQIYTSSTDNVVRENGILKIKAIKEPNGTYSSARIKTQDKFEFKYGRVEIRAKLPSAQGTWPALWMLGANFPEVGWPQCGEIDIMEQYEDKTKVKSSLHWKLPDGQHAQYGVETTNIPSNEWHVYTIDWTPTSITTYLDGNQFFTMNISGVDPYYPFNEDFFFIFNVAMGGTLGGDIDPNFTEDTMEVDYIRVYQ